MKNTTHKQMESRDERLISQIWAHAEKQPQRAPSEIFQARLASRLKKPSRRPQLWISMAAMLLVAVTVGYLWLPTNYATVTAVIGLAYADGEQIKEGSRLHLGATIETRDQSHIVVRFGSVAALIMEPNTSIKLTRVRAGWGARIELEQLNGTTLNRIEPGRAHYVMTRGEKTFSVLGTAFVLDADAADTTRVTVLHGTVATRANDVAENVGAGTTSVCNKMCSKPEKHSAGTQKRFERLETVLQGTSLDDVLSKENQLPWSTDEIRDKYGRLSRIETTTGETFVGGFIAQKDDLLIQTKEKRITLKKHLVKKILPANNGR